MTRLQTIALFVALANTVQAAVLRFRAVVIVRSVGTLQQLTLPGQVQVTA
jgi:hypothetical protein